MKNKIISLGIMFIFLFTIMISADAIAPTPRVDLDEYQIVTTDSSSVYVSGTLSICVGQDVGVFDSNGKVMYTSYTVANTKTKGTFKLQVPARYIKEGKNTFKVKSTPVKGVINGSNPKTLTVELKNAAKKNQTITATNLVLKVNETKNLNAKVDTGLPLTFTSNNTNVAIVDAKGNVLGKTKGSTTVTIKQAGNSTYNSAIKNVSITVNNANNPAAKEYTITYHPNGGKGSMSKQKVKDGNSIKLTKNSYTKDGYTFKGWNTSPNSLVLYKNNQTVTIKKNIILYAIWEKNKTTKAEKIIATCDKLCYVNKGQSSKPWNAKNKSTKPKDAARQAFKRRGFKKKAQCADCGYFVSTVIYEVTGKKVKILGSSGRASFPGGKQSIKKAGFTLVSKSKNIPLNKLKPGDVIRYHKTSGGQHTLIYYGNGKVAEAGRSSASNLIRWPVIQNGNKKWTKKKIKDFQVWRIQE